MVAAVAAPEVRDVRLYPAQFDFVADEARWVAFVAGRNAGKTYAGSLKAALRAQRGGLGIIAAPDFPMLEFGAKRAFLDRLREARVPFELANQRGVVTVPAWDCEVRFATLETEGRVRGPNYDWGWVDEVEYVADRAIWAALKGAIRAGADPQLFVTTTPKGRRLVYDEWVANATPHHALHRASTFDNPHIDAADYVAGLGYVDRFYRQEIEAQFEGAEGLVYPGFDREQNVRSCDCEGWGGVVCVDAGTRNPTAVLTLRHAGDARHVERETYRRGMDNDQIKAEVIAAADALGDDLTSIEIDPSAAGLILALERLGYPVRKADNNVADGIRDVATALADGLTVDPSCVNTVAEFESYAYPDGARGESDKPVKQNDHAMDALRYGIRGLATPVPRPMVW